MYAKNDQNFAMSPYQMGHSPMAPVANMMAPQQPHWDGFGTAGAGLGAADGMIVLLSDVVDLRCDIPIPFNVEEEIFMLTLSFPR